MSTEFVGKMFLGLKHIAKGEDFEGKREVMLVGLKCVEMYICEEENKYKDDDLLVSVNHKFDPAFLIEFLLIFGLLFVVFIIEALFLG